MEKPERSRNWRLRGEVPPSIPAATRVVIFVVAVAAILIVMFVTGWADNKAPPGSTGRGTVTQGER